MFRSSQHHHQGEVTDFGRVRSKYFGVLINSYCISWLWLFDGSVWVCYVSYSVENRFIRILRHFNVKYLLINRPANTWRGINWNKRKWPAVWSKVIPVACGKLIIRLQHCFRKRVGYVKNVCGKYSAVLQHCFRKIFCSTSALFSENNLLYFSPL